MIEEMNSTWFYTYLFFFVKRVVGSEEILGNVFETIAANTFEWMT